MGQPGRLVRDRAFSRLTRAQADLTLDPAARPIVGDGVSETDSTTRITRHLSDIYGRPLAVAAVDVPRRICPRGHNAVTYASAYLIGAAVIVLILLVTILTASCSSRSPRATRHAVSISEGKNLTVRASISDSRDEDRLLAREFDSMVERVKETRNELVDKSFQAGFAEASQGRAAQSGQRHDSPFPSVSRISRTGCVAMPAEDLELACGELKAAVLASPRQSDLMEFLRLGCREISSGVGESKADIEIIQRQAQIVQTALSELMRSTRNEAVIESVRLPDLVSQTLEIVPDASPPAPGGRPGGVARASGAPCVRVARTVLRLVLQNLIINAADAVRDAGRDKGVLKVGGGRIVREHDRDQLHLHCKDNGVGISEADLERVFDKGFSTKSRDTNYGIGLHWCANAIAALGGRIWAASEGLGARRVGGI